MMHHLVHNLVRLQGGYYLLTGVWSLLHRRSFEAITGPKQDYWLVQTVGVLVMAIGGLLAVSPRDRSAARPHLRLATGSALALAAIDLRHGLGGTISRIYALDGVLQLAFATAAARELGRERGPACVD